MKCWNGDYFLDCFCFKEKFNSTENLKLNCLHLSKMLEIFIVYLITAYKVSTVHFRNPVAEI